MIAGLLKDPVCYLVEAWVLPVVLFKPLHTQNVFDIFFIFKLRDWIIEQELALKIKGTWILLTKYPPRVFRISIINQMQGQFFDIYNKAVPYKSKSVDVFAILPKLL